MHEISIVNPDGSERPLTPAEQAVLVMDPVTGHFSILSTDYALDGQVWSLKVTKKSTQSTSAFPEDSYTFTLEFRDICWDS